MNRCSLLCFLTVSVVHLYFSWRENSRGRACTKPFLLIFLMLYYMTSGTEIRQVLLLALLFSWLGDVLLIPRGNRWFFAGGICFLLAHFFFVQVYVPQVQVERWMLLPVTALGMLYAGLAGMVIFRVKRNVPRAMRIPMYLYLLANGTMNLVAWMQWISEEYAFPAGIALAGAVLFFLSDCSLYVVRYDPESPMYGKHFWVMLTYLLGEFLITQGMLWMT